MLNNQVAKTLIIPGNSKPESNNCFIIHCFEENNDKHTAAWYIVWLVVIMHCIHDLQSTVKPVLSRHPWEMLQCPLNTGCPLTIGFDR